MQRSNFYYRLQWNNIAVILEITFELFPQHQISNLLHLELQETELQSFEQADFLIQYEQNIYLLTVANDGAQFEYHTQDDFVVNTVNQIAHCFLKKSKQLVLHGGALIINHQAVLFSGLSHAGKTSLAVSAWLAHFTVISDDLLACDSKTHTVTSFPKPIRVRLPSLEIPSNILDRAGINNVMAGNFLYDQGIFIGRKSPGLLDYDQKIPIKSFYYIERGKHTKATPLQRNQALSIGLTQIFPNTSCLQVATLINNLVDRQAFFHLSIGENESHKALELISA